MTVVTPQLVKQLRDRTGIGIGKCKEALEEAQGDVEMAIENLRKAGIASAVKKEGRETNEGMIFKFEDDATVALVEINVETDFVAKNERFTTFGAALAEEICQAKASNLEEFIQQPYSKDPSLTIDQFRATLVQELGENIQVRRIEHFPKKSNTSLIVYTHGDGKLVTLVELTGAEDEHALGKEIAMHIAFDAPEYLSSDEVPERVIAHEKEIAREQIKGKPEHMVEKILEGKLKAYFNQVCLLYQKFIKDPNLTIQALVDQRSKESGKQLAVSQFLRWKVGE